MRNISKYILEHLATPDNAKAFTIIKPGFIEHEDEIHDYIKSKGFIMHDHTNPIKLSDAQIRRLYGCHNKEEWYGDLCKYMASGDVVAAVWAFDNEKFPNTNTISLMKDIKQHFREKYGKSDMENCMHSSDSLEHVKDEASIIFN